MPYLLLTLAALFWGGNYVVGHVLVQGVDPILMTEARWALTALLLGLLYRRQIVGSRHLLRAKRPGGGGAHPLWPGQLPAYALYWPANHLRAQRRHLYVRHAEHGAVD